MSLSPTDFPCPKCGAWQGEPCVSLGGSGKKVGEATSRPHHARKSLVPPRPAPKCGTYSGYQRHGRLGEVPCSPCREANAAHMRDYRDQHPADRAHENRKNAARHRALWRLAAAHPDEFRRFVAEEAAS